MINIEILLKIFIFLLLGFIIYYSSKCLFNKNKLQENLTNIQYCDPQFTASGTEVTIKLLNTDKYLAIDPDSSVNNILLKSNSDKWEFERIIDEKSVKQSKSGFYNEYYYPNRCSMFLKTKYKYNLKNNNDDMASQIYYYLTLNGKKNFEPGLEENYVSASLFGNGAKQIWYAIDISSLKNISIYKNAINIANRVPKNNNSKLIFIVTNPIAFQENKETPKTQFLTANYNKKYQSSFGSITINTNPTEYSIWEVNFIEKGKIETLPDYEPTLALGEYPNNKNKEHGTFMNTFLPIWNRKWYSSDKNNSLKHFSIKLESPWYKLTKDGNYSVKNISATGTVYFDGSYPPYLANKTYNVTSQGSDMLVGYSQDKSDIILKMIPREDVPLDGETLPKHIPMLQGMVIKNDGTIISLCASDEKNLAGICLSLNKKDEFQKYLLQKDLLPFDKDKNFSLSKDVEHFKDSVGNLSRCAKC